ncbi:hypothetical protein O3P69_017008 [Scylla paramamosain]|uniref:Large ribosomal subunit protein bL35m n=1 Tax=Scylla paramamosain TaxID=85552 RepID=A0AAW0TWS8_SCYPA
MLRSLCRLTAHSRVVTCALRPAVQATPLETFSALLRASATVSSQNLACQYSTGVRQTTHLSLKGVSGGTQGIWIRARAGARKRMWKKSPAQRRRCKTHVFCNATQSYMLDKMVTRYWRRMRFYPDDPYAPYMNRENFRLTNGYPKEFY